MGQPRKIPCGSLFRVVKDFYGTSQPERLRWNDFEFNHSVLFHKDDIVLIGDTRLSQEANNQPWSTINPVTDDFVQVFLPQHGWINRVYFNLGLGFLERISS